MQYNFFIFVHLFRKVSGSPYPLLLGGLSVIDAREYFCEPLCRRLWILQEPLQFSFIDRLIMEFRTIFMKNQFRGIITWSRKKRNKWIFLLIFTSVFTERYTEGNFWRMAGQGRLYTLGLTIISVIVALYVPLVASAWARSVDAARCLLLEDNHLNRLSVFDSSDRCLLCFYILFFCP